MASIEICFSPHSLELHSVTGKIVVVTDIFRATSCMVSGLACGMKEIVPVALEEEAEALRERGFLAAGERNGEKLSGYDLGNSPYEFMAPHHTGRSVAMTTTNGTRAISMASEARQVVIGAFLNLRAIAAWLQAQQADVLVLCAGWKNRYSLEDALFAGALAAELTPAFTTEDDGVLSAITLYRAAENRLKEFLHGSSHARRLKNLGITKDLDFCVRKNEFNVVPILQEGTIRLLPR